MYAQGAWWSVGKIGTFLIREYCLNSFSWRSPAQQAKPKVCLYHKNPLNSHRESWELNLSWQFLSSFLCFVFFLHNLFPRAALGPGYKSTEKRAMEGDREGRDSLSDNALLSGPLYLASFTWWGACSWVCFTVWVPSP